MRQHLWDDSFFLLKVVVMAMGVVALEPRVSVTVVFCGAISKTVVGRNPICLHCFTCHSHSLLYSPPFRPINISSCSGLMGWNSLIHSILSMGNLFWVTLLLRCHHRQSCSIFMSNAQLTECWHILLDLIFNLHILIFYVCTPACLHK